jgi:RNA polymerase sigma-70 factor (ECF subfamily)
MVRRRQRSSGAELDEIEAVYRTRLADFRRVAAALTGDRQAALDVVQEAFGSAIRRRETFRRTGEIEAWVWRIVVNTARDYVKTAGRRALAETSSASPPSENGARPADAALAAEIGLLPERQRLALFLRYYADLDYAAIAAVLGIRPGTVAATLNAAHTKLRQRLEEVVR